MYAKSRDSFLSDIIRPFHKVTLVSFTIYPGKSSAETQTNRISFYSNASLWTSSYFSWISFSFIIKLVPCTLTKNLHVLWVYLRIISSSAPFECICSKLSKELKNNIAICFRVIEQKNWWKQCFDYFDFII